MSDHISAISTDRLRLSKGRDRVFPPVTAEIPAGSLVAVLGASRTGKTALLLTLAGRMRGFAGSGRVFGFDVARDAAMVRGRVGLGVFEGINDLTPALTTQQHIAEQRLYVPSRARSKRDVLAEVGLTHVANERAKNLDAEVRFRLGLALALVRDVSAVIVDDIDRDLDMEQRARVLELLRSLADSGITVVMACVDATTAEPADVVIKLPECDVTRRLAECEEADDAVA